MLRCHAFPAATCRRRRPRTAHGGVGRKEAGVTVEPARDFRWLPLAAASTSAGPDGEPPRRRRVHPSGSRPSAAPPARRRGSAAATAGGAARRVPERRRLPVLEGPGLDATRRPRHRLPRAPASHHDRRSPETSPTTCPVSASSAAPARSLFTCLFASQAAMLVFADAPESRATRRLERHRRAAAVDLGRRRRVTAAPCSRPPRGARAARAVSLGRRLSVHVDVSAVAPSFAVLAGAQACSASAWRRSSRSASRRASMAGSRQQRAPVLTSAIVGMPAAWIRGMPRSARAPRTPGGSRRLRPRAAGLHRAGARPPAARGPRRGGGAAPPPGAGRGRRFTLGELWRRRLGGRVACSGALLLESYDVVVLRRGSGSARPHGDCPRALHRAAARRPPHPRCSRADHLPGLPPCSCWGVRPATALTLALFAAMAFINGRRRWSPARSAWTPPPRNRVAVMSLRAAASHFGYLLGAAAGGSCSPPAASPR